MSNYARCCTCGGDADTDNVTCMNCDKVATARLVDKLEESDEKIVALTIERDALSIIIDLIPSQFPPEIDPNGHTADEVRQLERSIGNVITLCDKKNVGLVLDEHDAKERKETLLQAAARLMEIANNPSDASYSEDFDFNWSGWKAAALWLKKMADGLDEYDEKENQ